MINGGHHNKDMPEMSESVTRDEFALFDIIKIMSVLGFFASLIIMLFSRWGFHAVRWNKSNFTRFLVKHSKWIFGALIILGLIMWPQGKEMKSIKRRHRGPKMDISQPQDFTDEILEDSQTEEFEEKRKLGEWKRGGHHHHHFEAQFQFQHFLDQDEDICFAHGDEDSCNADSCSWCKAFAVFKSACHSVDTAKKLTPLVFSCSKLAIEEPVEEFEAEKDSQMESFMNTLRGGISADEETCNQKKDDASCDATGCSWCRCPAIPSACHSIENAKELPSEVFICDNLGE